MKKRNLLFSFFICAFCFLITSCSETEEAGRYDNWKNRNDAFVDSLKSVFDSGKDSSLKCLKSLSNESDSLFYKVITVATDENSQSPYYTSEVECFYEGKLINGDRFDGNFTGDIEEEFDTPTAFTVGGVIKGWTESLQHMKEGERWMIYIPYQMAYNDAENNGIPKYSTLIFDMKLHKIRKY